MNKGVGPEVDTFGAGTRPGSCPGPGGYNAIINTFFTSDIPGSDGTSPRVAGLVPVGRQRRNRQDLARKMSMNGA
jgi:hypothetical protein